jgi:hypothetical protein
MARETLNSVTEEWEKANSGEWVDEWGDKNDIIALRDFIVNSNLSTKKKKLLRRAIEPWYLSIQDTVTETVERARVIRYTPANGDPPFIRLIIRKYDDEERYLWNAPIETYDPIAVDNDTSLLNPALNSTWVSE